MKRLTILLGAALLLTGVSHANAMEPICDRAALIAAAAFKQATSLGYEQMNDASFESVITPNMSVLLRESVALGNAKFRETYLVQEENTGTDDLALVVIEAYNKNNGICVIKTISAP